MINATLKQLSQQLATGQVSAVELATAYLDRIDALNPALNAFITVDREKTLIEAAAADARRAAGQAGLLTGVPIAHKDIFCQQGWKTSCGSKMLDNFISPYNAHVIDSARLPAWSRWVAPIWKNSPWARPTRTASMAP